MFKLFLINMTILFVWFPWIRNALLNLLGFKLHKTSKVGLSLMLTKNVKLGKASRVSHFNCMKCDGLLLMEGCSIGKLNYFKGQFEITMQDNSHIGNSNVLKNNGLRVIPKASTFNLGKNSNITSSHYIDMSCDVRFGSNAVLAGRNSTIWTHGFVHFNKGSSRLIKLESVRFGDGVYIGSNCVINPGTIVCDDINVGSGTSISGRLEEVGLYVNSKLRFIKLGSMEKFLEKRNYDPNYKTGNVRVL